MDRILEVLLALARGTATCQTVLNGDEDDDLRAAIPGAAEDDDDDHDSVLMDNVADLCGNLGKVAGALLAPAEADALFQAFSRFVVPARSALDRAMAVGCFADLCIELPADLAAARHFATLHPLFVLACADTHPSVARNGAFGLGALVANAPAAIAAQHVQPALQTLFPLLERARLAADDRQAADRAAADNAVASMCRIARAHLDSGCVPVEQVVGLVLPLLPLREDVGENKTVVECLLALLAANHPALPAHLPELRRAFNDIIARRSVDDPDVAAAMAQAAQRLQ